MARFSRSYFSWIRVAVVVGYGLCTAAYGDPKEYRPTLVFRIVNGGQVPQEMVEIAKTHVDQIYGHSGIHIEWVDGDEKNQPSPANGSLDLTMIFVPESVAQIMNLPKEATGFAVSNDGGGCRRAYIFVERVEQQAVVVHNQTAIDVKTATGVILGEVIAHEAGHLMLAHNSHSERGIMRARLGMDSIERARRGNLLFTPDQTKQIRTVLLRHAGGM